jgi:NADH:ubiquinone oxidoreductase subunit F (NADH-binding)/(2Fe-2S) ferredoxin/Pyruvate/2-oxoacid:ferredoxin oxidoreductase delta subunit
MHTSLQHLAELKTKGREILFPDSIKIMVGSASCGLAAGAAAVFDALLAGVKKKGLRAVVTKTGCAGICHEEPVVDISIPDKGRFVYGQVMPESVSALLDALKKNMVPDGALFRLSHEESLIDGSVKRYPAVQGKKKKQAVPTLQTIPFYKKQYRIALRNCGLIDPENIREYIALGGYSTLATILAEKTPQQVISEVKRAGLRGRGGAGFLTGLKWSICRDNGADQKYIICNADEGDPGAYMDRSILEGDPHSVVEGMLIAAYAIGATRGYIYVRDEYPLAITRLEKALDEAQQLQLLGEHVLRSAFSCSITIIRGAGAFVCGEETALIKSIEGACGEPNQRPPYPAVAGLWGKPTVINNVETLATVPVIMAQGARWFSAIGTQKSKGTKVFSLVGKVNHIGLVEVPMGTTLREIIYGIGGGVPKGRTCKAVQTGGPSGGCIPEKLFSLPVDYEALAKAGSIMGSGGLIVMDDRTCMVDVARYFMTFLEHESCGKCTPCRVGVRRMRELLDAICSGTAAIEDLEVLEHMATMVSGASLCGLGRTAPNPVLSGLRHFKDEFLAHIRDKKCPAGVCKPLVEYAIDPQTCVGCGACLKACPAGAVTGSKKKPHSINRLQCIKCGACEEICPAGAVAVE